MGQGILPIVGGGGIKVLFDGEKLKAKELALGVDFNMKAESPVQMKLATIDHQAVINGTEKPRVLGGELNNRYKDSTFDINKNDWLDNGDTPILIDSYSITGCMRDNVLYVIGSNKRFYKKENGAWTQLTDTPFDIKPAVYNTKLLCLDGKLHTFGQNEHWVEFSGKWTKLNNLEGYYNGSAIFNNKLVTIVYKDNNYLFEEWEKDTDTWSKKTINIAGVADMIEFNGKLHIGGSNSQHLIYDGINLTTKNNFNSSYYVLFFCKDDKNLYYIGKGYKFYKYQPNLDQWDSYIGGLPFDFHDGSAILDGKYPRILSKRGNAHYDGKEWFVDEPLPIDVQNNHAIYLDGKIHIFNSYGYPSKIMHYEKNNNVWVKKNDIIATTDSLNGFVPLVLKDKIHMITFMSSAVDQKHLIYNSNSDNWSELTAPGLTDSPVQNENYAFVVNKDIISTGYQKTGTDSDIKWLEYNDISNTWTWKELKNSTASFSDNSGWSLVSFKNNVYLIGNGYTQYSQNRIYELTDNTNINELPGIIRYDVDWSSLLPTDNQMFILGSRNSEHKKTFSQTQFKLGHILY